MDAHDCIYPDCQIKTEFGDKCEHSCEWEKRMKRPGPDWQDCMASELPGGSCQFPKCDC